MTAEFLGILKKESPEDHTLFSTLGNRFSIARKFGLPSAGGFWFSNTEAPPWTCELTAFPDKGREKKQYPCSRISIDPEKCRISLEIDAMSSQAIYKGEFPGVFLFSDSITEIFEAAKSLKLQMNPDYAAIDGLIHFGITPVGKSFVQEINGLAGGRDFVYGYDAYEKPLKLSEKTVRRIDFTKHSLSEKDLANAYLEVFSHSIDQIVESTNWKPIGVLFSGGFDSSVVLKSLRDSWRRHGTKIFPFTAINEGGSFIDENYAQLVTSELGISREEIGIREKDFSLFSETISELGDGSESWGLGILLKRVFEEGNKNGVEHFISGSGTDAPIGGSVHILSALWYSLFDPKNPAKTMLGTKTFWDFPKEGGFSEKSFQDFLEEKGDVSFLKTFEETISETLAFMRIPGKKALRILPEWIFETYWDTGISRHDLITLSDLVTHSHRFGNIYSKISKGSMVQHISPFTAESVRNLLFQSRALQKLHFGRVPVTTWDNQSFYKAALSSFAPKSIGDRTKIGGSFADKSLWLFSPHLFSQIRSQIANFLADYGVGENFSEKILSAYGRSYEIQRNLQKNQKIDPTEQGLRIFYWRILCASETMKRFFPEKTQKLW